MQNVNAVAYAFLEVYPDVGMYSNVPQKPVDAKKIGTVYWSDPWTDLFNNDATTQFCNANYTMCYFAYDIEKDPAQPRPPVDLKQPWNYFFMGNFDAFTKLPNVKHIISIGGWYHEKSFEDGAFVNPDNFVNSIVLMIKKAQAEGGSIDGIDFDYEPPNGYTTENGAKLAALTKRLRQALDENGWSDIIITAAVFANTDKINQFGKENWQELEKYINYIGIMGYDFHGSWDRPPLTGLQSNLYNDPNKPDDFSVVKAIEALVAAGVPESKLVLGVPSYGRVVGGVTSTVNNSLYQTFDPNLILREDLDKDQVSYYKMIGQWINKGYTDYTLLYDGKTSGVWAYNPANQQFVSYDNTVLVDVKADYVLSNKLGGMMLWELISDVSPDDPNNASLLKHMHDKLQSN
jgi:chitinase